jgi:NAD(P)-dependent dehydrogenase (short-subunit alcohol dehydrogenase family)
MDLELSGKTAIVTGGAGGIGSATAFALAEQGVDVLVFDLRPDGLDDVAAGIRERGTRALTLSGDVTKLDDVERAVEAVEREWGGLDLYVSVAGGGTAHTLKTMTPENWHAVIDLNLTGPFNGISAAAPALRRRGGGAIVTVGSLAGLTMSMNNGVSYTAAKAGVLGLTRHSAFELARDEIRVNAVLPGPVLSPQMVKKLPPEIIARVASELPLGRWVRPEQVATAILYYCSSMSSGSTGDYVIVDSGHHIGANSSREEYFARRDL